MNVRCEVCRAFNFKGELPRCCVSEDTTALSFGRLGGCSTAVRFVSGSGNRFTVIGPTADCCNLFSRAIHMYTLSPSWIRARAFLGRTAPFAPPLPPPRVPAQQMPSPYSCVCSTSQMTPPGPLSSPTSRHAFAATQSCGKTASSFRSPNTPSCWSNSTHGSISGHLAGRPCTSRAASLQPASFAAPRGPQHALQALGSMPAILQAFPRGFSQLRGAMRLPQFGTALRKHHVL